MSDCLLCGNATGLMPYHINAETNREWLVCHDCARDDIAGTFKAALEDEAKWPFTWGDTDVLVDDFLRFLPKNYMMQLKVKVKSEYEVPVAERVYCRYLGLKTQAFCNTYQGRKKRVDKQCWKCHSHLCGQCLLEFWDFEQIPSPYDGVRGTPEIEPYIRHAMDATEERFCILRGVAPYLDQTIAHEELRTAYQRYVTAAPVRFSKYRRLMMWPLFDETRNEGLYWFNVDNVQIPQFEPLIGIWAALLRDKLKTLAVPWGEEVPYELQDCHTLKVGRLSRLTNSLINAIELDNNFSENGRVMHHLIKQRFEHDYMVIKLTMGVLDEPGLPAWVAQIKLANLLEAYLLWAPEVLKALMSDIPAIYQPDAYDLTDMTANLTFDAGGRWNTLLAFLKQFAAKRVRDAENLPMAAKDLAEKDRRSIEDLRTILRLPAKLKAAHPSKHLSITRLWLDTGISGLDRQQRYSEEFLEDASESFGELNEAILRWRTMCMDALRVERVPKLPSKFVKFPVGPGHDKLTSPWGHLDYR